jgi:hypothetical protein
MSKRLLEKPRQRKTKQDLTLRPKVFKKLLMMPQKISMTQLKFARRLMQSLLKLLIKLLQKLRS